MQYLSGYKTYLAAAAGILATLAAIASGHLPPADGLVALLMLVTQAFQRAGVKTDTDKVRAQISAAATVTETVAPIVVDLQPQLCAIMARVEELAEQVRVATAPATPTPSAASINPLKA